MARPKLLVFASGTREGGGSGFENLVASSRAGRLEAEVVAVVSNHAAGGVRSRADRLAVPFIHFAGPWDAAGYRAIAGRTGADFVALSGWLKHVDGLDPGRTFNIHPGPLPGFGGPGLYGRRVHEAVLAAYRAGRIDATAVSMHFVGEAYDEGAPIVYRGFLPIRDDDTVDTLAARVHALEHRRQPEITHLIVQGAIRWGGRAEDPLVVPPGYMIDRHED